MGTFDEDVDRYLTESRGQFKDGEVLEALMTLGKVGAEFAGVYAVAAVVAAGGGLLAAVFPPLQGSLNALLYSILQGYGSLDTEQRRAAVTVAGWTRKLLGLAPGS